MSDNSSGRRPVLPKYADDGPDPSLSILAGVPYANNNYKKFQRFWYGKTDAQNVGINMTAPVVRGIFNNDPAQFQWGHYQTEAVPRQFWPDVDPFWGVVSTFDLWRSAADDMRMSLAQQPDPQNPARTLLDRMNDLHRQAFWPASGKDPTPLVITVAKRPGWTRKHGVDVDWDHPGNPNFLNVRVYCPNIGKQSSANSSPSWENGLGGWIAWALFKKPSGANKFITKFRATLQIPSPPLSTADPQQLLYVFPGLQATKAPTGSNKKSGILQPILQWGSSPVSGVGGGPSWYVGSWYVGLGQPWETIQSWQVSGLMPLDPGTSALNCEITQTSSGGNLVDCSCRVTGDDGTVYPGLDVYSVPELDLASIALECYGVDSCDDFPATKTLRFTNVAIEINNTPLATISWVPGTNTPAAPFPNCGFAVVPSGGGSTIAINRA